MGSGTITQATATVHILKTIQYKVGLRKVDRKHVKHKVLHYFSVLPGKNARTK